jgi:hypothetical protein
MGRDAETEGILKAHGLYRASESRWGANFLIDWADCRAPSKAKSPYKVQIISVDFLFRSRVDAKTFEFREAGLFNPPLSFTLVQYFEFL